MSDTVVQIQYWFHQEHFYHRAQTVNILQLDLVGFWIKFDSGSSSILDQVQFWKTEIPSIAFFRQFSWAEK